MKAINNNITVQPIETMRKGLIYLSQSQNQKVFYGRVTSVGEKVSNKSIKVDSIVCCDVQGVTEVKDTYFVNECGVILIRKNNLWRPVGRKLLVQREVEEFKTQGGVIIPSCYKSADQSMHCVFILNGILNDEIYDPGFELIAGDVIRLAKWNDKMKEIEIDGKYNLIIKPSDILYSSNDSDVANRIIS